MKIVRNVVIVVVRTNHHRIIFSCVLYLCMVMSSENMMTIRRMEEGNVEVNASTTTKRRNHIYIYLATRNIAKEVSCVSRHNARVRGTRQVTCHLCHKGTCNRRGSYRGTRLLFYYYYSLQQYVVLFAVVRRSSIVLSHNCYCVASIFLEINKLESYDHTSHPAIDCEDHLCSLFLLLHSP